MKIVTVVLVVASMLLAGCGGGSNPVTPNSLGGGSNYAPPQIDLGGMPLGSGMDLASDATMCLLCSVENTYNENYGAGQAGNTVSTDVTSSGDRGVVDLSTTDGAAMFCWDSEAGIFKQGGCASK